MDHREKLLQLLHSTDKVNIALALELSKGMANRDIENILGDYEELYQFLYKKPLGKQMLVKHLMALNQKTTLDLEETGLEMLPDSLANLRHLIYLNIT